MAGWLKRGPTGIIATTMQDAFQTATTLLNDMVAQGHPPALSQPSNQDAIYDWLRAILPRPPVTFDEWKWVEQEEERRGQAKGKPREKLTSVQAMLDVIEEYRKRRDS